jgi:mono/diheme cytochrome c family protein
MMIRSDLVCGLSCRFVCGLVCGLLLLTGCDSGSKTGDGTKPESAAKVAAAAPPASGNPFAKSVEAVIEGRKLFLSYGCAACHGMGGGGGMGKPIIDDEWVFAGDDKTLFKLIRGEIPNQTMPNTIGKGMTDEEVWKALVYVRSIYAGDASKIDWVVPPPVTPEMLAAASKPSGDPMTAGKQVFVQLCVPCHGPAGRGDGPASAALEPKPRNLTEPGYVAKLDDRYLFELVSRGGVAVGKSPLMPAQPSLTAQDITSVITYVRWLSSPPAR